MDEAGLGAPDLLEITVGKARLAATRRGEGGSPRVVLLHTGISDMRSWGGVMELLSPDMDVIAYDRRGFGATAYKAQRHDPLDDLLAVLDALAPGPVVLVGNSMGGRIALDFTLAHPTRVAALVLVAPAISGAPEVDALEPVETAIWEILEAADTAGALDALNLGEIRLWLDGPHAPEGRIGGDSRELALAMNRIALHAEDPGPERGHPPAWDRLTEVDCPVLVVAGTLDLIHITERAKEVAARIPGARLELMRAAHLPGFERPAAFARLLREFLGRPAG